MKNTLALQAPSRTRRALRILKAMKGHYRDGLSNKALAALINDSPANISRTLPFLLEEGMIERRLNGNYALSEQLIEIALAFFDETERAQIKMAERHGRCVASSSKP
ncbi:hypothetical protein CBG25_08095 [Arsenophonus sp. ENCA]|uniref:IclR family transcriptional regulator n=1 Tax=Arsenophonus sp. ENCA TaxID=1987579 RepID=UPI000BDD1F4C|nr:IclR family transcriptional regulator [Arsenophonus sp. ENCA]PAV03357.1 hypothetical protein CBG25_08095 [Arsenophonus sp. ENCA]